MKILLKLRDQGNTVVVIEHNLDVIRSADWIIDLGPGGGDKGGNLVCEGPPAAIRACKNSVTGKFLGASVDFKTSSPHLHLPIADALA